jgi:hypothetical protein
MFSFSFLMLSGSMSGKTNFCFGAYLGQEKTKEDCADMKADNNRLKLADFWRGCVPLQNQQFKFSRPL